MTFLSEIKNKELVVVEDIVGQYKVLMAFGIFKGTILKVIKNDQWQQIILVELERKRVAIRMEDAKPIKVVRLNEK